MRATRPISREATSRANHPSEGKYENLNPLPLSLPRRGAPVEEDSAKLNITRATNISPESMSIAALHRLSETLARNCGETVHRRLPTRHRIASRIRRYTIAAMVIMTAVGALPAFWRSL